MEKQLQQRLLAFYKARTVLVTGGAGFIGSHLVEQLVALGAQVTVLDNLSTGLLANIAPYLNSGTGLSATHATGADPVRFVAGDIQNQATCDEITAGQSIIFHLAAISSVPASYQDPRHCYLINSRGTSNLLESARLHATAGFVFSSSSAVYGTPQAQDCEALPASETAPCVPTSPYGTSKLVGELLCKSYHEMGLPTASLRYFNVYGARQRNDLPEIAIIPRLRKDMGENRPITLQGNGLQQRDFVPVHTVVEANLLIGMGGPQTLTGDSYNIATGTSITLIELFNRIKQEFPSYNQPLSFGPQRPGDISYSAASCSKYEQVRKDLLY